MKLDTNLFAGKPPSLEEGPMRYQQPGAIVANRVEIRSNYQRCIQVLKVILYLELILFIGWIGCVKLSNYYLKPEYNGVGVPLGNPDWMNHISDDGPSADSISLENYSPVKAYVIWTRRDDDTMTNIEQHDEYQATTEPTDYGNDLIEFEKSTNPTFGETEGSDIDTHLSSVLGIMANMKNTDSDDLDDRHDSEEPLKDTDTDEEKIITSDNFERDEPFKSFDARWEKIRDNIDEGFDEFERDTYPSSLLGIVTNPKVTDSDDLDDRYDSEEPLKDADTDVEEIITSDNFERDEPFKSFDARWEKIRASIDEDFDEFESDTYPSSLLEIATHPKISDSDDLDDRYHSEEPLKDADTDEEKIIISDNFEREEPFKSFDARWDKIRASIDEDFDAFHPKFGSNDEFEATPSIGASYPDMTAGVSNEDSFDTISDPLFELPFLHELLLNSDYPVVFPDSDELDSLSDDPISRMYDSLFQVPQPNERNFLRNVRDIGAGTDSDSNSSSDETITPARKTKRSAESSSDESDEKGDKSESSDSSSSEEAQIMTKIPSKCPKILDEDGTPIDDPMKTADHTKKNWLKLLLETPVPNCGGPDAPKSVRLNECGKIVIVCNPSEIEKETSVKGEDAKNRRDTSITRAD